MHRRVVLHSLVNLAGATAVTSLLWPLEVAATISVVVASHEFGHYHRARVTGGSARPPSFYPFGPVLVGMTITEGVPVEGQASVAEAGPFAGLTAAVVLAGIATAIDNPLLLRAAASAAALELVHLVVGGDATKARHARKMVEDERRT